MLKGKHLISGEWTGSDSMFGNEPISDEVDHFSEGTSSHVDAACEAAEAAYWSYSRFDWQRACGISA